MIYVKMHFATERVRYTTTNIRLVDSSHTNYAMNPAAFLSGPCHYNAQAFLEVWPQLIQVSHSGFIMMHGLNEGHIAPYKDFEFQMKEYQIYFYQVRSNAHYVQMHITLHQNAHYDLCHITTIIGLVDSSHMNYAMNPAFFSAAHHYNV